MTVRVTVHPGEDIDLSDGATPSAFRSPLAALLRRPELRYAPLLADGVPVPEDRGAGERPLLPGATLTLHTRTPPGEAAGRSTCDTSSRPGIARRSAWYLTRTRHSRGTALRALSPPRPRPEGWWLLGLLPVIASIILAVTLRQPILAVFALAGLAAVIPQLLRRRSATRNDRPPPHRGGPAALLAFVTAARHATAGSWQAAHAAWADWSGPAGPPPGWPGGFWTDLLADQAVAVIGPEEPTRAVARAIVADLAVQGRPIHILGDIPAWNWCRWLATPEHPTTGPAAHAPVLVVDHGSAAQLAAAHRMSTPDTTTIVVGATDHCRTVLTVRGAHIYPRGPDIRRHRLPNLGVTAAWAEHFARQVAGARHLGRTAATLTGQATPAHPGMPDDVPLRSLHEPESLDDRSHHPSHDWRIPLGRSASGPVNWDLITEGPHLLVAGTTGSGKSELLRALTLGLALHHPPSHLALGLIDFKGGAGLRTLTTLPHVTGHVTDLDPALAERALDGLHAELRRRKTILAHHGATDLADLTGLDPPPLPRLVIVVDEFRALTDELPEFVGGLVRIAAQGRSLGVHLVLATQRPSGAVSADVRANITTRLALRVTDPMESRDIVDCADAAHLPVNRPGRAILRIGSAPVVALQCAHTGSENATPLVRRAVPHTRTTSPDPTARSTTTAETPQHPGNPRPAHEPPSATDIVATLRHRYQVKDSHPSSAGPPLWLPPLPPHVTPEELTSLTSPPPQSETRTTDTPSDSEPRTGPGLPIALGDLPAQQRRTVIRWNPRDGNLPVLGPARSGRSTALAAIADAALARRRTVHAAISGPPGEHPLAALTTRSGMTISQIRDLPELLDDRCGDHPGCDNANEPAQGEQQILLIDDLDLLRTQHPGWQPPNDLPIAFASSSLGAAQALRAGPRLVLLSRDRAGDVALGAPARLAGTGGPPGRAAWCGRTDSVLCQVTIRFEQPCGNYL